MEMQRHEMQRQASFDCSRTFRYSLSRIWDTDLPRVTLVGLNPSTADDHVDDPTIRRCVRFAQFWGFGGLVMTNLFAYRSTTPESLFAAKDPVGPDNDDYLRLAANESTLVIAAWGNLGSHRQRDCQVQKFFPRLHYLRLTKSGQPGHPLYLPGKLWPVLWQGRPEVSNAQIDPTQDQLPARTTKD